MSQALGVLSLSSLTSKKFNFNVFQKLPIEIRLKIWKLAELDPRLIVLNCVVNRRTQVAPFQGEPLLSVCHESRSEARKTYKLYHWKGSPQRYVRVDVDIFYFSEVGLQGSHEWEKVTSILRLIGRSDMRHIKHLALDLTLWLDLRNTFSDNKYRWNLWLPLLQLERVIMVIRGGAIEKQEGDTPEENPWLNFWRMDSIIAIRSPQLAMKNKKGFSALKTFRQWAEKDFKNTSRQHRKWKMPRLEFKMLLDGERILRSLNEYDVLEEESGYAGDREDN
jgi:2EXR family